MGCEWVKRSRKFRGVYLTFSFVVWFSFCLWSFVLSCFVSLFILYTYYIVLLFFCVGIWYVIMMCYSGWYMILWLFSLFGCYLLCIGVKNIIVSMYVLFSALSFIFVVWV